MTKNKFSRYFIIVSVFTFLAIFFQIVQQSYNNLIKPTIKVEQSSLIRSVNPKLDVQVLDKIEKRQELNP